MPIFTNFADIPTDKYNIIYADLPWAYDDETCDGAAQQQYNTMNCEELSKFDVGRIAAKDCILFLWATYPKLDWALNVIKAWNFEYKSIAFQWVKLNPSGSGFFYGLGRWTRGNTEPCLLATKGTPKRISESVFQLIISQQRGHSRKPLETYSRILKLVGDLPRIELFARETMKGWDSFGDQVNTDSQTVLENQMLLK